MTNIQKLVVGAILTGSILSASNRSLAPVEASVTYSPYYIPQYNALTFVDVAVTGSSSNNAYATLTEDGRVFTHGYGLNGLIGNGANVSVATPAEITLQFSLTGSDKIVNVEGGYYFSFFALSQSGRVFSWGNNTSGQLGQPVATATFNTPTEVTTFSLNAGEKIIDMRIGSSAAVFRSSDNRFFTVGSDSDGRLGRITTPNGTAYPVPGLLKANASTTFELQNDETFIDFGLFSSTGFISTDKRLYSWGLGTAYLHGEGNQNSKSFVTEITAVTSNLGVGETIVSATIGAYNAWVVTSAKRIWAWGITSSNSLTKYLSGAPVQTPFELTDKFFDELDHDGSGYTYSIIGSWEHISKIQSFDLMTFIEIRDDEDPTYIRSYYAWGRNGSGASSNITYYFNLLGTGSDGTSVNLPYYIGSYDYVSGSDYPLQFVNQGNNSAILTGEGGVSFIGANTFGQLGNGLTGVSTSTDYSGNYNTEGYYYVMSFEYDSRNLQVNYADYVTQPFTKENVANLSNDDYWNIMLIIAYYNAWPTSDDYSNGYNYYENLDDVGRDLFDETILWDVQAAFFDYAVQVDFPEYVTVESLRENGSSSNYWDRLWMEELTQYYVDFGFDYEPLPAGAIALLEPATETALTSMRETLATITDFETHLKNFRNTVDIYDESAFNEDTFTAYESTILDLFAEYKALSEYEQLLFDVYNEYDENFDYLYGYYDDLMTYYFNMYIAQYEASLNEIWNYEDTDGYRGLLDNLDQVKSVLAAIDNLPEAAREYYTYFDTYNDQYDYESYTYWIYLNDLVEYLDEATPVYEDLLTIEEGLVWVDGDVELTGAQALAILANYADYLLLSEDAQNLLDPEYMDYLYYAALSFYTNPVYQSLTELANFESENGTRSLIGEIEGINAAIAAYELLTPEMLALLDEETQGYYEYLKSLLPTLIEAQPVHDETSLIDSIIWVDGVMVFDEETALRAIANYQAFLALSEEAQGLFDAEYMDLVYETALAYLAGLVEEQLYTLYEIEDNQGTDALFDNLDAIATALANYEALGEAGLAYLDEEAIAYYEYLKTLEPLLVEATPVRDQIIELPTLEEVTANDIQDILAVLQAYNGLSDAAKALVDGDLIQQLLEAATRLAIDALPTLENLTLDDEASVVAARTAYDALTQEQKDALGADYLARLVAAEGRILELKAGNLVQALLTFGIFVLHFGAAAYFFWIKRKALAKLTGLKVLAKY